MIKFVPGRGDFTDEEWEGIRSKERKRFRMILKMEYECWRYDFIFELKSLFKRRGRKDEY